MKLRRNYDREFKQNAVKLSNERKDISSLARELGITTKLLYSWRSQYKEKGKESFPGQGNMAISEEAKLAIHLKKENERLQKENDILKKVLGIISKSDL